MWGVLAQGIVGLGTVLGAGFSGLMAWYMLWKYFALYLPNKQAVDECLPSGGTCSIDGFANLETSGVWGLSFLTLTVLCLAVLVWLINRGLRFNK